MFQEKKVSYDVTRERDGKREYWFAELFLKESGAFSYGNGTRVELHFNGQYREGYDTRYDNRVIKDFKSFAYDLLKEFCSSDCVITEHIE